MTYCTFYINSSQTGGSDGTVEAIVIVTNNAENPAKFTLALHKWLSWAGIL
jgi:hypothetical protein